ncbi:hypothetical protein PAAG_03133 [Paracoccidioides lutzii Pb01]|uniref:Uncharacterized protein n=1 Tax=Paracoccidioides lutzii (strain ATCC MYA-826 / Pb01) TaxID=502779 RepID=C1GYH9_PARBA|nr:hypothetical protein PAAG_03133 [Paracoccidioides lutzii Pb01]EEH41570.2 hypothetical protein PAAG_03133 [Paracoccidioides lutzii Pb01]
MGSQNSFAPSNISRTSISYLLSLYPHTISEFYKAKLVAKSTSKRSLPKGKSEEAIGKEVEAFLKLDRLRYDSIPAALRDRAVAGTGLKDESKAGGNVKRPKKKVKASKNDDDNSSVSGLYLEKDEIVNLMDWKLKHGSYRPALMGLIRSNENSLVQSTTNTAFSQLQDTLSNAGDETFPAAPLETLTGPLRGVGPATASLFLSIAPYGISSDDPSSGVNNLNAPPFFSDELFNWLCLDKYKHGYASDGSGAKSSVTAVHKIKYNMKEYQQLWEAARGLRKRINQLPEQKEGVESVEGDGRIFSVLDIEKVAFVIGHLDISGYEDGIKRSSVMKASGDSGGDDTVAAGAAVDSTGVVGRRKRKRG